MIVLLRSESIRYSISIRTELVEGLPKVMADRVQLQQVLMNLMLNGIEAMVDMDTGGKLTIGSQQGDYRQLLISVGDTGVELEPEQAEQIFNAFFTTKPQGSGMGLPISRSIIESHGGHLWATSNSGPEQLFSSPCAAKLPRIRRRSQVTVLRKASPGLTQQFLSYRHQALPCHGRGRSSANLFLSFNH
jgi:signal transduction histidine kinase